MLSGPGIAISLSQAKIYHIECVLFLGNTYKEIIGLHIPVNEGVRVQIFYT